MLQHIDISCGEIRCEQHMLNQVRALRNDSINTCYTLPALSQTIYVDVLNDGCSFGIDGRNTRVVSRRPTNLSDLGSEMR